MKYFDFNFSFYIVVFIQVVLNNKPRPAFCFHIYFADIFANDSNREQNQPADSPDGYDCAGPAPDNVAGNKSAKCVYKHDKA